MELSNLCLLDLECDLDITDRVCAEREREEREREQEIETTQLRQAGNLDLPLHWLCKVPSGNAF